MSIKESCNISRVNRIDFELAVWEPNDTTPMFGMSRAATAVFCADRISPICAAAAFLHDPEVAARPGHELLSHLRHTAVEGELVDDPRRNFLLHRFLT